MVRILAIGMAKTDAGEWVLLITSCIVTIDHGPQLRGPLQQVLTLAQSTFHSSYCRILDVEWLAAWLTCQELLASFSPCQQGEHPKIRSWARGQMERNGRAKLKWIHISSHRMDVEAAWYVRSAARSGCPEVALELCLGLPACRSVAS